jgi:hypothetical protein
MRPLMEQLRKSRRESVHRRAMDRAIRNASTPAQRGELVEFAFRDLAN